MRRNILLLAAALSAGFGPAVRADVTVPAGASVQAAVDDAPAGSVVRLAAGTYLGRVNINKPLTLEGAGWDKTTIGLDPASLPAGKSAVVSVRACRGVVLRGVKVQDADPTRLHADGAPALIAVTDAQCRIDACAAVGGSHDGVTADGTADVSIEHGLVAACWNTGITAASPARLHVADCEVRNNYQRGLAIGSEGAVVETSRIGGSAWHGIRYDDCSPVVRNCWIGGNARSGIYASGVTHGLIQNDTFQKNEMDGVSCWFYAADFLEGNAFVDNVRDAVDVIGDATPTLRRNSFAGSPVAIVTGKLAGSRRGGPELNNPVPTIEANAFGPGGTDWKHLNSDRPLPPGNTKSDKPPAPTAVPPSKFPVQPEETAMIPTTDTRDYQAWQRPDWIANPRRR